jgi:DNA-binding PadR family transcriptional regulator
MPISSDLIRGHIDTIIMARLKSGDTYGYEINRELRERTGGSFEIKEATLYSAFRRLESSGMISSYWGPNEGGARRRYYTLTNRGRSECARQLEEWLETRTLLDCLLETED